MASLSDEDDGWVWPNRPLLQHYIVDLMSYKHGRWDNKYERKKTFTKAELLTLRPVDIKRWLSMRAFGIPNPNLQTDTPDNERSSSLCKAKSGVSVFMPNQHLGWIDGRGGNPTIHKMVQQFIKDVVALETKGLGKKPNDKRPYRQAEWDKVLEMLRRDDDFETRWKFTTMSLWAYHLIHRIDDTSHFKVDDPHGSHHFAFALFTRTRWSKNVRTMKHCPDQIILASGDWKNCIHLSLANYLEQWLTMHPEVKFLFTTNPDDKKGPGNIKQQYRNRVAINVWSKEEFKALEDEPEDHNGVGTTSGQKFFADKAQKAGATDTQVEYRGRWVSKKGREVVNRHYIRTEDPYVDAYVASLLCDGGPIKYESKEGLVITDEWLFANVVPSIRTRYERDNRLCRTLGLARLWGIYNEDVAALPSPTDVARIKASFGEHFGDIDGNPVKKVKLEVLRVGTRLEIIPAVETNQQPQQQQALAHQNNDNRQIIAYLQRIEENQQEQFQLIRNSQAEQKQWLEQQVQLIINNQRRFGGTTEGSFARQQPDRRRLAQDHTRELQQQQVAARRVVRAPALPLRRGDIAPNAQLANNVKTLLELWREYNFGIGTNKPARQFTSAERNQSNGIKMKYSRRMCIWRVQVYLLNAGLAIEAANQRIIDTYQTDKPTAIILCIKRDQKNQRYTFIGSQRFHPRLIINQPR